MGTAILLGIPQKYVETAKAAIKQNGRLFTVWDIKYAPSNGKATGMLQRDVDRVEAFAEERQDLHILGFSSESDRQNLAARIAPYFRFRWFKHQYLKCLGSPDPPPIRRRASISAIRRGRMDGTGEARRHQIAVIAPGVLIPSRKETSRFMAACKRLWRPPERCGRRKSRAGLPECTSSQN